MAMAATAFRSVLRSSSARNAAARVASQAKAAPSPFRLSPNKSLPLRSFRSPVEMSFCLETMLPFHSATASSLMTSMLSISCRGYGQLPEVADKFVIGGWAAEEPSWVPE